MGNGRKFIGVQPATHRRLTKLAGKLQQELGEKRITIDEAISYLFKRARVK